MYTVYIYTFYCPLYRTVMLACLQGLSFHSLFTKLYGKYAGMHVIEGDRIRENYVHNM